MSEHSNEQYSADPEDQLQPEDTLDDRGIDDVLDEGFSPPEKWSPAEKFGNTPYEEEVGETLDQRLEQERPEVDPYEQAAREAEDPDLSVTGEGVSERAGRLVDEDGGIGPDERGPLDGPDTGTAAEDIGIDGAGASAEEAAVHRIDDVDDLADLDGPDGLEGSDGLDPA